MITEALTEVNGREGTQYELRHAVLDAVHYGVPQRRSRAILVAVRDGTQLRWPEATHATRPTRAWDALADISEKEKPQAMGQWTVLLPSIPEGSNYLWHTSRGGGTRLFGYRTRYWSFLLKLAKAEPGWTISAHPGPATGPFHWENRPLSLREMLRLQTFPRSWRVSGDYRAQVRQIGNATPPLLAEVIGRSIGEQMFGLSYDERPRYWIARKRSVPDPAPVAGVPREFLKHVGNHPAHPGAGRGPKPVSNIEELAA
jgi:DNA (cytosine-5)-methyltransferase 1